MDIPRIERPHVFMRLARACLRRTERFLEAHPIRTAGQDECVEAGHDLRAAYADGCDAASAEEFPLRTGALWHVGKVVAVSALLGAALSVVLVRWYTPP